MNTLAYSFWTEPLEWAGERYDDYLAWWGIGATGALWVFFGLGVFLVLIGQDFSARAMGLGFAIGCAVFIEPRSGKAILTDLEDPWADTPNLAWLMLIAIACVAAGFFYSERGTEIVREKEKRREPEQAEWLAEKKASGIEDHTYWEIKFADRCAELLGPVKASIGPWLERQPSWLKASMLFGSVFAVFAVLSGPFALVVVVFAGTAGVGLAACLTLVWLLFRRYGKTPRS